MISIEINDVRTANMIRESLDTKADVLKSALREATNGPIDMVVVTELVTDINTLTDVSNQIGIKTQLAGGTIGGQ